MSLEQEQKERSADHAFFRFERVDGVEALHQTFALRYQVYCLECGFLSPDDYPDEKEVDEFDHNALHFAAHHNSGELAGAVRLARATPGGEFPFHRHCKLFADVTLPPQGKAAEISRLVVRQEFRRRLNDNKFGFSESGDNPEIHVIGPQQKRRNSTRPEIVLGLYRAMYQESKRQGITHWYAAMEKSLARLLLRYNFAFVAIGPEVDYYGPVTPYLASLADLEEKVSRCNPDLFEWFTSAE